MQSVLVVHISNHSLKCWSVLQDFFGLRFWILLILPATMGRLVSMVTNATYKRSIPGSIPAGWTMLRPCVPRQGTFPTRALFPSRSKWVPDRTVKACAFEQFCAPEMAAGLYALRGVEMAYWINRSRDQGILCKVGWVALRARYETINLHLYLYYLTWWYFDSLQCAQHIERQHLLELYGTALPREVFHTDKSVISCV